MHPVTCHDSGSVPQMSSSTSGLEGRLDEVAFADERGLAAYRAALEAKGRDQAWEQRRREQDLWYNIVARSVQTSPPATMTLPRCSGTAAIEPDGPPETRALPPHPHPQLPPGVPHAPISGSTRAPADDGSG